MIGVDEEDSKPKLPVIGFPYDEHLRERINNLILGNIMPPLFPEIQICASPDGATAFAVVRVAQSELTCAFCSTRLLLPKSSRRT